MKKVLCVICSAALTVMPVFVQADEFSQDADMQYDYNERYDETDYEEESTDRKYDSIDTEYNEEYDAFKDEDTYYGEGSFEPDGERESTEVPSEISVYVDGEPLSFDVPPAMINDRTMVPMRRIFEALGASVTWDEETQTAVGVTADNEVRITVGESFLRKNGKKAALDTPATVISDRTLIPVRAVAESFDCSVEWVESRQAVLIFRMKK